MTTKVQDRCTVRINEAKGRTIVRQGNKTCTLYGVAKTADEVGVMELMRTGCRIRITIRQSRAGA